MKAFSMSKGWVSQGISLVQNFNPKNQAGFLLALDAGRYDAMKQIYVDDKNPPKIEKGNIVYDCGVSERTLGSEIQHVFIAGRPNDNRALLHIFTHSNLLPYFNETFPKTVVRVGVNVVTDIGSFEDGASYLLIFNVGDTIAITGASKSWEHSNENYIHQWDGIQFRGWVPEDYLNQVVKPWMTSASKSAIDQAVQEANYPLLRQFLVSGLPQWKEL